jgi:hypothetical protein
MTFIALAVQVGHGLEDTLCGCRCILWQLHTLFYTETMTWNRFLHMPCFLHFACSLQRPEEGEDYDWLWKLRTVSDTLNQACAEFYNPSENLAVKVIVKFKGGVTYKQYIPKKRKSFGIKIYKMTGACLWSHLTLWKGITDTGYVDNSDWMTNMTYLQVHHKTFSPSGSNNTENFARG